MCMCEECANALRLQSNRCPVCRTQITTFLQVEIERRAEAGAGASASAAPTSGGEHAVPVQS